MTAEAPVWPGDVPRVGGRYRRLPEALERQFLDIVLPRAIEQAGSTTELSYILGNTPATSTIEKWLAGTSRPAAVLASKINEWSGARLAEAPQVVVHDHQACWDQFWDYATWVGNAILTADYTHPADATEGYDKFVRTISEARDRNYRKGQRSGAGGASKGLKEESAALKAEVGRLSEAISAWRNRVAVLEASLLAVRNDPWRAYAVSLRDQLNKALPPGTT